MLIKCIKEGMGYTARSGEAIFPEVGDVFDTDRSSAMYLVGQYSEFFEIVGDDKDVQALIHKMTNDMQKVVNENTLLKNRINELESAQGIEPTQFDDANSGDDAEAKAAADAEKAKAKAEAKAAKSSKK